MGRSVRRTFDGGYIVAGSISFAEYADVYLIKTDACGELLWEGFYGGASPDWGYSVQQTSDGGYIIAGATEIFRRRRNRCLSY